MEDMLVKANEYVDKALASDKSDRPLYHFSCPVGWMNDPNGFSYFDGQYHLFFQFHPYDTHWGPMHWGHVVSDDMLEWKTVPIALAPDMPYDKDGCFSGSAIETADGRHLVIYTGYIVDEENVTRQVQCMATGDGRQYEKWILNPVLNGEDLPEEIKPSEFRDPKMWLDDSGKYKCVCVGQDKNGLGNVLLYESSDGYEWEYRSTLLANDGSYGKMWECPDFFTLDDTQMLIISPQGLEPKKYLYPEGNGSMYITGVLDKVKCKFNPKYNAPIDYGIDYYASQTCLMPDGRRILIGWMQHWNNIDLTDNITWQGMMTIPRELSVKNGRLYQWPIKELENRRKLQFEYDDKVDINNWISSKDYRNFKGREVDINLSITEEEIQYENMSFRFAAEEEYYTELRFNPSSKVLTLDRSHSNVRKDALNICECRLEDYSGELQLRILLDLFSVEVFIGNGEKTMTATFYTDKKYEDMLLEIDGTAKVLIKMYSLT